MHTLCSDCILSNSSFVSLAPILRLVKQVFHVNTGLDHNRSDPHDAVNN